MRITVFGILLLAYIFYIFLKSNSTKEAFIDLFLLSIFLYLNITIGYVVKIEQQTIAGYFLAMVFAAISGILCIRKVNKKNFVATGIFIICILLSLMLIPFREYQIVDSDGWDRYLFGGNNLTTSLINGNQIKKLIKAVAFIFVVETVHQKIDDDIWLYIVNKVLKWTKVVLCYGIFEFIAVYVFQITKLYTIILQPVFGLKESTYTSSLTRGGGFQLQGLFTEPSSYATGLFLTILLFITQARLYESKGIKRKRSSWIWIGLSITLMLLSMSFSSLLYCSVLLALTIIYIYYIKPKYRVTIILYFLVFAAMGSGVVFFLVNSQAYYGERIISAFYILKTAIKDSDLKDLYFHVVHIANDGSSISRLGSSIGILKMEFMQNPLVGLGIGTGNSYAAMPNMLTDMGIIGTVYWYRILVGNRKRNTIYANIGILILAVCSCLIVPFDYLGADIILLAYIINLLFK